MFVDTALKKLGVRYEEIVADELYIFAEAISEHLPTGPVVFAKTILNRYDRVVFDNPLIPVCKIVAGLPVAVGFEFVMIVFSEFG